MHVVAAGMDRLASHSQPILTLALRATARRSLALCLTSPTASCLTGTTVVRPSEVSLTCCPSHCCLMFLFDGEIEGEVDGAVAVAAGVAVAA